MKIFAVHARWQSFHICACKQQVFCLRIDLATLLTHAGRSVIDTKIPPAERPRRETAPLEPFEERTLAPVCERPLSR